MGQSSTRPIEHLSEGNRELSSFVNEEPDTRTANSNGNIRTDSSINPGSTFNSISNHVTNVLSAVSRVARSTISFNPRPAPYSVPDNRFNTSSTANNASNSAVNSNPESAPYSRSDHSINFSSAVHRHTPSLSILNPNSDSDPMPATTTAISFTHTAPSIIADRPINTSPAATHGTRSSTNSSITTSIDGDFMLSADSTNSTSSRSPIDTNTVAFSPTDTATDSAIRSHSDIPININPLVGPVTRSSLNSSSRYLPYSRPDRVTSTENRSARSSNSDRPHSTNNASSSLPSSSDNTASRSRSSRSARSSRHNTSTRHTASQSNANLSTSSTPTETIRFSRSGNWFTSTSHDPASNCTISLRTNALTSTKFLEELKLPEMLHQAISTKRRSGRIAKRKEEKKKIDKLAKEFYERKIKEGISHPDMSECQEEARNYVPTEEEALESLCKARDNVEKKYDSDDSLNSDSDLLTEKEWKEQRRKTYDKKEKERIKRIINNPVKSPTPDTKKDAAIQEVHNRRREEYRATLPYPEAADEFLSKTVAVYNDDTRDLNASGPRGLPPITRYIFQQCLQAMEILVPEDQMGTLGCLDYKATINQVDNQALTDRFEYFMINTKFFRPPRETAAVFIKNKARKIIYDHNIQDVLRGPYGFQLTTKDCVEALSEYYNSEFFTKHNRDSTDLTISIRGFVHACFVVSRRKGPFDCNPALQYVILEDQQ